MATDSNPTASPEHLDAPAPFRSILCGIDGSRAAAAAASDAIAMAGPDGRVTFLTCPWRVGQGLVEKATLDPTRATKATDAAQKLARDAAVDASVESVAAQDPTPVLLERSAGQDLLVLGSHGGSRAAGIALGSTASTALHRAHVPVLLSRRRADDRTLFDHVIVASDGSPASDGVVEAARRFAPRSARMTLLHAGEPATEESARATAQHSTLADSGGDVSLSIVAGAAHDAIEDAARAEDATLVVLGSRGLQGLRALGSVSERVAHRVPCSVLVLRGAPTTDRLRRPL